MYLECYVFFMRFTKVSQVGCAAVEEGLQASVLLRPPYSDSNLPFQLSITIFHNSCIRFNYQNCFHVTPFRITMMLLSLESRTDVK